MERIVVHASEDSRGVCNRVVDLMQFESLCWYGARIACVSSSPGMRFDGRVVAVRHWLP